MTRRKVILAFLLAVWLLTGPAVYGATAAAQPPPDALTLSAAVQLAMQNNPMLEATAAGIEAASAQLSEARASRMPSLRFSETYTNSNNPVYVFGSLLEQGRFGAGNFDPEFLNSPPSISNFRSTVSLKVPVFNRFQMASGIRQAEIREGQASAEDEWARQHLRLQVIQAYFGLLLAGQRTQVAEESVRAAQAQVDNIRAKVETGVAVTSDLLAMEVQLAEFRQQLVQAEGDERTALAALNTVLALDVNTPQILAGNLEERGFPDPDQANLIDRALQLRPDYQNVRRQVDLAEQQVRSSRGQWYPDFNIFAQVANSTEGFSRGSGDFAIGANLNFDILDLGRPARIRQAVAATRGARAEVERTGQQIRLEVVRACQNYLSSKERVRLAEAAVDQAQEALRIVEDRHEVGLTTITEVLRAQTALLRARLSVLGARYDQFLGFAGILLASGSLDDVSNFSN